MFKINQALKFIFFFFLMLSTNFVFSKDFIDKGYFVIDLKQKVDWLKCAAGQRWNDEDCEGTPVKLSLAEANEALKILNDQIDGEWRLPKRKELEGLICKQCEIPKINKDFFPSTPAEPFWTSQRNWWSPKFFWSVNFFTGHTYGRFVPEKKLFVRFLRER
tara:strand:- start:2735 stop:3217 length:483 start_codon:yes stop_codon:yes gene_type:complete